MPSQSGAPAQTDGGSASNKSGSDAIGDGTKPNLLPFIIGGAVLLVVIATVIILVVRKRKP
jgi:hypothetical protein